MIHVPGPRHLVPGLLDAFVCQSFRNAPDGLWVSLASGRIPTQERLVPVVEVPRRLVGNELRRPAVDDAVIPVMFHMVSCGAGTVEGLREELQELLLVSQGRTRRQLKDFSNELQPLAVLRIVTLHASILDVYALWRYKKMLVYTSRTAVPRVRISAYGTGGGSEIFLVVQAESRKAMSGQSRTGCSRKAGGEWA
jgi:hypothetical protein